MDAREVAAREAIRELVARYNQLGDAGRLADLVALFTADGVLEFDGRRYAGHDSIGALFEGAAAETRGGETARFVRHFVATHSIEVESEVRAHGRSYFQVLTDRGLDHWGRYRDEYALDGGEWRFTVRRIVVDGQTPGGWAERASRRLPPA